MIEVLVYFVVSFLAMFIAMLLIIGSSRVTGWDHSFGELGRELLIMLGVAGSFRE